MDDCEFLKIMNAQEIIRSIEQKMKSELPQYMYDTESGKYPGRNKERTQPYDTPCNGGINETIRRIFQGVGVERCFSAFSLVERRGKVRRAKLLLLGANALVGHCVKQRFDRSLS